MFGVEQRWENLDFGWSNNGVATGIVKKPVTGNNRQLVHRHIVNAKSLLAVPCKTIANRL